VLTQPSKMQASFSDRKKAKKTHLNVVNFRREEIRSEDPCNETIERSGGAACKSRRGRSKLNIGVACECFH